NIIVHENGHFLAAYLQCIHVSRFVVGFGLVLAKVNAKSVDFSISAFPLGGFVGFIDNDSESDILVDDENLLKNRPIIDRVLVISEFVDDSESDILVDDENLLKNRPIIDRVLVISEFAEGLCSWDIILSVNGNSLSKSTFSVFEVVDMIRKSPGRSVAIK
ncbi:hypothetical protein AMTR_s00040p00228500, partial [Amborella trichopoda]